MKKLLILMIVLTTGFGVYAQKENKNAAIITFDKSVVDDKGNIAYDYGTIYQNSDGKCEFKFTNTGKEPLVLSKVRSSCGCTVPSWPRKPILPGKSESIKVKYDTKRLGTIHKSISIYSNASNSPQIARIKGKIIVPETNTLPEKNFSKGASPSADNK
ncbi:MAG: DUF1573 domain-containing protein [Bacteroidota bacterium]|nr:DUF1573 domain-containing protein [Bacteroidota bacterium]